MSKFKTEIVVPVSKLKEWLVTEGYLHNQFSEAELNTIIICKHQVADYVLYENLEISFETDTID